MKYKPIIIGIAGTKSSGKDTAASMINYIINTGVTQADYYTWKEKYNNIHKFLRIIHFADNLKDMCSKLFNISRNFFDNEKYKNDYVWSITHQKFFTREEASKLGMKEILINDLQENGLPISRRKLNVQGYVSCISIRTILQYIGTDIFRNLINPNIWVDLTIDEAKNLALSSHCIIPDVRFKNECEAIKEINDINTVTILIKRNTKFGNPEHESEIIDFNTDYIIENNDSLMVLFYKLLVILKEIVK